MPTPYGSRGGMAFSAEELRVLRGALAVALQSSPASDPEIQETFHLASALDEALREGHRLRSFLLADLARYRAALPGAATGYLKLLDDALAGGYLPRPDDLSALRTLCHEAAGQRERDRRTELLERCERLAEQAVRARLLVLPGGRGCCSPVLASGDEDEAEAEAEGEGEGEASEERPGEREHPGEHSEEESEGEGDQQPSQPTAPAAPSGPGGSQGPRKEPSPSRPIPTPGEVFPPRRPQAPPERPEQEALPA